MRADDPPAVGQNHCPTPTIAPWSPSEGEAYAGFLAFFMAAAFPHGRKAGSFGVWRLVQQKGLPGANAAGNPLGRAEALE